MIKARAQQWVFAARNAAVTFVVGLLDREGTLVWEGDVTFPFTTADDAGYEASCVRMADVIKDNIADVDIQNKIEAFILPQAAACCLLATTGGYGGVLPNEKSRILAEYLTMNAKLAGCIHVTTSAYVAEPVVLDTPMNPFRALWVSATGNVQVRQLNGDSETYPNVPQGTWLEAWGDMVETTSGGATVSLAGR